MLTGWEGDLRSACRAIRRSGRSSALIVLLLAIGIGGGGALMMLLETIVLSPIAAPHADRLALVEVVTPQGAHRLLPLRTLDALDERQSTFAALAGHTPNMTFQAEVDGRLLDIALITVSGDYYDVQGLAPHVGRLLTRADNVEDPGDSTLPVVLGYDFWREAFDADPAAVGRVFLLDGVPVTVVGVTPRGYRGLSVETNTDIAVTMHTFGRIVGVNDPRVGVRANYVVGRLRDGVTVDEARENIQSVWPAARQAGAPPVSPREMDEFLLQKLVVTSFRTGFSSYRTRYGEALATLLWMLGALLVLIAANLSGLLIARNAARATDWRVRRALGARAGHILRLATIEAGLYVAAGLALAGPIMWWCSQALVAALWLGSSTPGFSPSAGIWTVAVIAAAAAFAAIVMSALPAWLAAGGARVSPGSSRTVASRPRRLIQGLVVGQLALSLGVASAGVLLARNLTQWWTVDPGYDPDGLTFVGLNGQPGQNDSDALATALPATAASIAGLPGVEHVGFSHMFTRFSMTVAPLADVFVGGQDDQAQGQALRDRITPGFIDAMGLPLLEGRDFTWADAAETPAVAIVTRSLADRIAPAGALGTRIRVGRETRDLDVIGVIEDLRITDPRVAETRFVFTPMSQEPTYSSVAVGHVRAAVPPPADPLRQTVQALGRHYVMFQHSMARRTTMVLAAERVAASLGVAFGGLALLIAATGLASLLVYLVERRRREIGVRLALGASRRQVVGMVVGQSGLLVTAGVLIGVPIAYGMGRFVGRLLTNIEPTGVLATAGGALPVIVAALAAAVLPALRAAGTDPIEALKSD